MTAFRDECRHGDHPLTGNPLWEARVSFGALLAVPPPCRRGYSILVGWAVGGKITMQFRRFALVAMAACLPMLSLACGDGGDDDAMPTTAPALTTSGDGTPAATTPTVEFTPVAFDPADQEYAAKLCSAFDNYAAGVSALLASDPAISKDINKLLVGLAPVLEALRDAVRASNPPAAVRPYHAAVEQSVQTLLVAVREGRIADITDFGTELGVAQPPKDIEDRMRSAGQAAPECEGNDLFFTDQLPKTG